MAHVYIIRNGVNGHYKIGIANNVERRLEELQVGNPVELFIVCKFFFKSRKVANKVEKSLHNRFKDHRVRGEWFSKKIQLSKIDHLMEPGT